MSIIVILPLITNSFKITEAKFQTIIRVKKFYAANCKKVPYRYLQGTLRVKNLLNFVTKSNKFSEKSHRFLLNSGQNAVGYAAYAEAEKFLVEPFLSKKSLNNPVITEGILSR